MGMSLPGTLSLSAESGLPVEKRKDSPLLHMQLRNLFDCERSQPWEDFLHTFQILVKNRIGRCQVHEQRRENWTTPVGRQIDAPRKEYPGRCRRPTYC